MRPGLRLSGPLAALALVALPALAEGTPPLTGAGFEALTTGRTMDTATAAGVYGVETFLPGRQVIWRDANRCVRGHWEEVQQMICFTYDDKPDHPVCWTYHDEGDRILGWFQGEEEVTEPIFLTPGAGPVSCEGYLGA